MDFSVEIEPRYGEIGCQGIVLASVWLSYIDDVATRFFAWLGSPVNSPPEFFDFSVVRADLEFSRPVRLGDVIVMSAGPTALGSSSFSLSYCGTVGTDTVIEATLTYVSVAADPIASRSIPDTVRNRLTNLLSRG